MKYCKTGGAHIAAVPVEDFRVVMVDEAKKTADEGNYCNAGFFGVYGKNPSYTLPAGQLVADYAVTDARAAGYCQQRGSISGGKLRYPCGNWDKQFYGKAVSTLVISGGRAEIRETADLPECDYAIQGIPVLRGGKAVTLEQVRAQGWDRSPLYATWHIFLGLKGEGKTVYAVGLRTTGGNLISSGEAARKLAALGITDAIALDGGGSFIFKAAGNTQQTFENRRINTIIDFGGNPWPVPTRALKQGARGNDVKWLQWELADRGFSCSIDGSFGPATKAALMACQAALQLTPDASCGPATRKRLIG